MLLLLLLALFFALFPAKNRLYLSLCFQLWKGRVAARNWNAFRWDNPPARKTVWTTWGFIIVAAWAFSALLGGAVVDGGFYIGLIIVGVVGGVTMIPDAVANAVGGNGGKANAANAPLTQKERFELAHALVQDWNLRAGTATGMLRSYRNDARGFIGGTPVAIGRRLAAQGVCFLGVPGGGKSRAGILNMLQDALRQPGTSALALVVKPTLTAQVRAVAQRAGRDTSQGFHVVGPGKKKMNLFETMTPEAIGNGFRDAIGDSSGNRFWQDAPASLITSYCRLLFGIGPCRIAVPGKITRRKDRETGDIVETQAPGLTLELSYSPFGLYNALFASEEALPVMLLQAAATKERLEMEEPRTQRTRDRIDALGAVQRYFNGVYQRTFGATSGTETTVGNILMTIEPYLDALTGKEEIREAFGSTSDVTLDVLDRGETVVIEIDNKKYAQAARLVHNIVFRQLQELGAHRLEHPYAGPCVVIADEYASMAANQHLDAWQEMRESEIIGFIGLQGESNLAAKVGDQAATGIMGCFSTKVVFKTNDSKTRREITDHVGQTEIEVVSQSQQNVFSGGIHPHAIMGQMAGMAMGNRGQTFSTRLEPILNGDIWSCLGVYRNDATAGEFKDDDDIGGSGIEATAIVITVGPDGKESRDVCIFPVLTKDVLGA